MKLIFSKQLLTLTFSVAVGASLVSSGCDGLKSSSKKSKSSAASSNAGVGLKAVMSTGLGSQGSGGHNQALRSALLHVYKAYDDGRGRVPSADICQSINYCESDFNLQAQGDSASSLSCAQTCLEASSKPVFSCSVRSDIEQTCSNNVDYTIHRGSSFTMSNVCELVGSDAEIHSKGSYQIVLSASDESFANNKLTCSWNIAQKIDFQSNSSSESSEDPFSACKGITCSLDGSPLSCEEMQAVVNDKNVSCEEKGSSTSRSEGSSSDDSEVNSPGSENSTSPVDRDNRNRIANTPDNCGGRMCQSGEYCLSSSYPSEDNDNVVYSAECRRLPLPTSDLGCKDACDCAHKDTLKNVFPLSESPNCRAGHHCQSLNGKVSLECYIGM